MSAIFQQLKSEIGERTLIQSGCYTTESSTIDHSRTSSEGCISRDIISIAVIGSVMDFTSKIESFTRHDQSDIADIFECRHDIVSSILFIDVCSRFPRNQFISQISQILLGLEEIDRS